MDMDIYETIRIDGIQFIIRNLNIGDFNKNYIDLMGQLSTVDSDKIMSSDFIEFVNSLDERNKVFVIEQFETNKIVGSITIFIENKIIHNMGKVCHIEDVVIDKTTRGLGLGKIIIDFAVKYSIQKGCYKTILDCSNHNIVFYLKCGFENKGTQMALYH